MRDETPQQQAVRQLLGELKAIVDLPPDQFSASQSEFCTLSDSIRTLVRTPALPGFLGPQIEWMGNRMVVR